MVIHACILRTEDGLPLSGTNNVSREALSKAKEAKQIVKVMAKHMNKLPLRACLQGDEYTVHSLKDDGTSYIIVCEPNYPHILAYSFLDELLKEFSLLYTPSVISSVKRPFGFVEFESYLEKVQHKYNSPQKLASRLNLSDMTNNLNINPPVYMNISDLDPPAQTIPKSHSHETITMPNGTATSPVNTAITLKLTPVPFYGYLVILMAIAGMFIDLHRGFIILSTRLEGDDGPLPIYGVSFLLEMLSIGGQVFNLVRYSKYRKKVALSLLGLAFLTNFLLYELRDSSALVLYLCLSVCLAWLTLKRRFQKSLPKHNI